MFTKSGPVDPVCITKHISTNTRKLWKHLWNYCFLIWKFWKYEKLEHRCTFFLFWCREPWCLSMLEKAHTGKWWQLIFFEIIDMRSISGEEHEMEIWQILQLLFCQVRESPAPLKVFHFQVQNHQLAILEFSKPITSPYKYMIEPRKPTNRIFGCLL